MFFFFFFFFSSKCFRKETRTAVVLRVSEMRRGGSINVPKCSLINIFDIALEIFLTNFLIENLSLIKIKIIVSTGMGPHFV